MADIYGRFVYADGRRSNMVVVDSTEMTVRKPAPGRIIGVEFIHPLFNCPMPQAKISRVIDVDETYESVTAVGLSIEGTAVLEQPKIQGAKKGRHSR